MQEPTFHAPKAPSAGPGAALHSSRNEPGVVARPAGGVSPRHRRAGHPLAPWAAGLLIGLAPLGAWADPTTPLPPERQDALVRVVRQDCGSCHGMRLTGGLGPALTRDALADKPLESMAATIFHGRPGTPMPGWRALISEAEARWIAEQLAAGFPEEPRKARP